MASTSPKTKNKAPVGLQLAQESARFADSKQASEISLLDLRGLSTLTDFMVVCSGSSLPHLRAIRDEIDEKLREEHGLKANYRDGNLESQWMVLDFIDVMVHIFNEEKRSFYALEDLWSDAPRLDWQSGKPIPRAIESDSVS